MGTLEIVGVLMVCGIALIMLIDILRMDNLYKIADYVIGGVFGGLLAYLLYLSL